MRLDLADEVACAWPVQHLIVLQFAVFCESGDGEAARVSAREAHQVCALAAHFPDRLLGQVRGQIAVEPTRSEMSVTNHITIAK